MKRDRDLRQSDLRALSDEQLFELRRDAGLLSEQAKKSVGFYRHQQAVIQRELNRRDGERRKP